MSNALSQLSTNNLEYSKNLNLFEGLFIDLQELQFEDSFSHQNKHLKSNQFLSKKRKNDNRIIKDSLSPENKLNKKSEKFNEIISNKLIYDNEERNESQIINNNYDKKAKLEKLVKIKNQKTDNAKKKENKIHNQFDKFKKFQYETLNKDIENKNSENSRSNKNFSEDDLPINKLNSFNSRISDYNMTTNLKTETNFSPNFNYKFLSSEFDNNFLNSNLKKDLEQLNNQNLKFPEQMNSNNIPGQNININKFVQNNQNMNIALLNLINNPNLLLNSCNNSNANFNSINTFNLQNKVSSLLNTNLLQNFLSNKNNISKINNNLDLNSCLTFLLNNGLNLNSINNLNLQNIFSPLKDLQANFLNQTFPNLNNYISNNNNSLSSINNNNIKNTILNTTTDNNLASFSNSELNNISSFEENKENKSKKRISDEDLIRELGASHYKKPTSSSENKKENSKKAKTREGEKEKIKEMKNCLALKSHKDDNKNFLEGFIPNKAEEVNQEKNKIEIPEITNITPTNLKEDSMKNKGSFNDYLIRSTILEKNNKNLSEENEKILDKKINLKNKEHQINPRFKNSKKLNSNVLKDSRDNEKTKEENIENPKYSNPNILKESLIKNDLINSENNTNLSEIKESQLCKNNKQICTIISNDKAMRMQENKTQLSTSNLNKTELNQYEAKTHQKNPDGNEFTKENEKPNDLMTNIYKIDCKNTDSICLKNDSSTSYLGRLITKNQKTEIENNHKNNNSIKEKADFINSNTHSKSNKVVTEEFTKNSILDFLTKEEYGSVKPSNCKKKQNLNKPFHKTSKANDNNINNSNKLIINNRKVEDHQKITENKLNKHNTNNSFKIKNEIYSKEYINSETERIKNIIMSDLRKNNINKKNKNNSINSLPYKPTQTFPEENKDKNGDSNLAITKEKKDYFENFKNEKSDHQSNKIIKFDRQTNTNEMSIKDKSNNYFIRDNFENENQNFSSMKNSTINAGIFNPSFLNCIDPSKNTDYCLSFENKDDNQNSYKFKDTQINKSKSKIYKKNFQTNVNSEIIDKINKYTNSQNVNYQINQDSNKNQLADENNIGNDKSSESKINLFDDHNFCNFFEFSYCEGDNKNQEINHFKDFVDMSNFRLDEKKDLVLIQSDKIKNNLIEKSMKNSFIKFYSDTMTDVSIKRDIFHDFRMRLIYLQKFPNFIKMKNSSYLFSIINNEVSNIFGSILIDVNEHIKLNIYCVRLIIDKEKDYSYKNILVPEKILKKKIKKEKIEAVNLEEKNINEILNSN